MLTELLREFVVQLIGFAIAAAIVGAWRFLSRFPAILVAIGVYLLAIAASLAAGFSPSSFRTEGSPAGTAAFIVVGGVIVFSAVAGLFLFFHGLSRLGGGESATPLRVGVSLASVAVVAGAALAGHDRHRGSGDPGTGAAASIAARQKETARRDRYRLEHEVLRRVEVTEAYALDWAPTADAPALAMRVPAADLRRERGARTATVAQTPDGVRRLDIALAEALPVIATMQLLRDEGMLDDDLFQGLRAEPAKHADGPQFLWAQSGKGSWRVLGFDCGKRALELHESLAAGPSGGPGCHEPKWLARKLPSLFGLEHVRLAARSTRSACRAGFRYRGRPVIVFSQGGACFDEQGVAALMTAAVMLDRMEREAATPPTAAERLAMAKAAVRRCEAAQGKARDLACHHALAVAQPEMASTPEAIALLLRALEAAPDAAAGERAAMLDAAVQALESAGRRESREMLQAHAMRLDDAGQATAGRDRARSRASLDVVLALAPKLLQPDDPLFEKVLWPMTRVQLHPTEMPRRVEALAALEEKARAADPGSEIATRTRYHLCRERANAAIERDTLGACADDLLAAWQARIAARASFEAFRGEGELAASIGRMYASYALIDPAKLPPGREGLQRVRKLAHSRFAILPDKSWVLDALDRMEASLADRARRGWAQALTPVKA